MISHTFRDAKESGDFHALVSHPRSQGSLLPALRNVGRVGENPGNARLLVSTWCNEFASNSWGYIMIKEAFLAKSTMVHNAFTIQINK